MKGQVRHWGALLLSLLSTFVLLSSPTEGRVCHVHNADVTLIFDTSGSVNYHYFKNYVKPVVGDLTEVMYATFTQHQTAMISYDHRVKLVLRFTFDQNKVRTAITKFYYGGGATNTGDALIVAARNIKRWGRLGKTQLVILFTDGFANYGTPVPAAVQLLHSVADRVIVVGITKYVKMKELKLIAKDSKVIRIWNKKKLRLAIPRIMYQICRILHKICPKPQRLPVRCVGNQFEYRTVAYYPWYGECVKKIRIRHVTVRCHHKFKPYYRCSKCKRYWVLKYALIQNCKCIIKTHVFHTGRCCCPKQSRSIKCKRTYKRIVHTHYNLINGKCWRRRVYHILRCGCPKGHYKVWCVMNRFIVRWNVRYRFIKRRYCLKVITKRVSPVVCRKVRVLAKSKRCFRLYADSKYGSGHFLKITLAYYERDGCKCIRKLKNVFEPCQCFREKRWRWIRQCHSSCRYKCQKNCQRVRVFLTYKLIKQHYGNKLQTRCVPRILFKHRYKCCCSKHRPYTKRRCKHGHRITWACFYKLFYGACHKVCRWTALKVHCRHGVVKRQIMRLNDGRYKVIDWILYKKGCRCLTKTRIKYIPWRCRRRGGVRRRCAAGILYVKAKYFLLVGFRCIVRVILVRIKVDCPHYTIFIRRRCDPRTKRFVLLYKKASQTGCKCTTVYIKKKGRPCYCPKKTVSRWKCLGNRRYKRCIVYYKLFQGRCIRQKRVETRRITTCRRRVWYSFQCIKWGIRLVFRHFRRLVRCRCIVTRKLVKKGRCNCRALNKKYSHVRRIYCDRRKNQIVTLRWVYIYDPRKHCCVRKTNIKRKTISCSRKVINHRSRCDINTWKRTLTRGFYRAENCACRRKLTSRSVSCRCKRRTSVTYCVRSTGVEVTKIRAERFDVKADRCVDMTNVVRRPTQCRKGAIILRTRCNGRTYTESILRAFRKPGTCACGERVTRAVRPCACPTKRRVTACHGYFKRIIICFYTRNEAMKKCVRSHKVSYKLRCRCPPSRRIVRCIKGQKITKVITYALRYYVCIRREQIIRQPIDCSKKLRQRKSKCRRCRYRLFTLAHTPLPRQCRCRWRVIFARRCRCCPCPRSTRRIICVGFAWKVIRTSWQPVFVGSCKVTCIPIVQVYYRAIVFPPQPQPHWTECKDCKQNWVYYEPVIKRCKASYRKVVTPQTRQCCCSVAPTTGTRCVNNNIVTTTVTYVLRDFQCVQRTIVETRSQPCDAIPRTLIRGTCDSTSCLRQVLIEVAQKTACVCKRTRIALFRERCCCLRKGYTRKVCLGDCLMTMTLSVTFNLSTRQCEERKTSLRSCIKCRGQKTYRGRCRPKSCHRFIYTKTWRSVDCVCRFTVTRRPERCCCRVPTLFRKTCVGNVIVRTRERFVQRGEKCLPVTHRRRYLVPCRIGVLIRIRAGKCNPISCKKLVVRTYEKRSGCTCVRFNRHTTVTCCCPPKRSRLVCVKNNNVVKVTVFYVLVHRRCMRRVVRKTVRKIPRCRYTLTSTKCNRRTKHRTLFYTFYKVVKCRCVKAHIKRRSYPCICRKPYTIYRRCHRRSCRQRFIHAWYVLVKRKNCRRRRKLGYRPCCCKKKKWSYKRCNRRTGQVEHFKFRRVFYRRIHRCLTFLTIKSLGVPSNCFHTRSIIKRGPCNKKTGRARDFVITYRLNRSRCRCVRRVRPRIRICSCKYLGYKTRKACRNGFIVKVKTSWVLLSGSCHPVRNVARKPVICKRNRRCVKVCDRKGCGGTLRCSVTRRVNCVCRRSSRVRHILCCCPSPTRKVTCQNPFYVETLVGYIMNAARDKCRRYVTRKRTAVRNCFNRKRYVRGKCNKRTCIRRICVLIYSIRKCRCVIVRKGRRVERCCCPRRKTRVRCDRRTGVVTRFTRHYSLADGLCLQHQHVLQTETRCDLVFIKVRLCHPRTGKRIVVIVTFRRVGCRCYRSVKRILQKCGTKPPRIKRCICKPGQRKRAVILIYYKLVNIAGRQTLVRRSRTLFYEPCVCRRTVRKVTCENSKYVKTLITQRMVTRLGQRLCINIVRRSSHMIRCRSRRITRSKCRKCVRKIRTEEWRLFNCKCRRHWRTRKEACDCHKRNSVRRFCKSGVKFVVTLVWTTKPGFRDCHLTRIVAASPVHCPKRNVIPLTRSCPVRKKQGYYRKYLVIWFVIRKCRCRKRQRFFLRLCKCRRNFVRKRCAGRKLIRKRFSFFYKYNCCFRQVRTIVTPIRCVLPRASLRASACRRVTRRGRCQRLITITERRVRRCVCRSTRRTFTQICCAPRPRIRTYIRRGYRVTVRIIYFLVTTGVLYNQDGVFVRRRVVRRRRIVTRRRCICATSRRYVKCNLRTRVKKITWVIIRRVGCRCIRKIRVTTGKCRCPPPRKIRYRCIRNTRRVDTIYYIFRNNACKRRKVTRRERCGCPKNRSWRFCDRNTGARVTCVLVFKFNRRRRSHFCQKIKHCRSRRLRCRAKRIVRSRCNKRTGKRVVLTTYHIRNRHRCHCRKRVIKNFEVCSCHHLNRRIKRCKNGFIERMTKNFLLSNGRCVLKLLRTLREIVCPKPKTFILKDCAKTGPRAGRRTKLIRYFVRNRASCRCQPRTRRMLIPCICRLLPGCKPKITRRCVRNVIVIRKKFCVLVCKVCEKRWTEVRRSIPFGRMRRTVGKCVRNKQGSYVATITFFRQIVKHCRLVWVAVGTRKRVCKCPPKRIIKKCISHWQVQVIVIRFFRHKSRTHCRSFIARFSLFLRCHRSHLRVSKCNPRTCLRRLTRVHYRAIRCKCNRFRKHFTRRCCCRHPRRRKTICAADGRTLVTRSVTFKLAYGKCFPVFRVISKRLECETRPPIVRTDRACRKNFRRRQTTTFVTRRCKCVPKTKITHIRCNCPPRELLVRRKCLGQWAVDRVFCLRYNPKTRLCRWRIHRKIKRRCRCPRDRRRVKCIKDDTIEEITTKYYINTRANTCKRIVKRCRFPIGKCSRRKLLVRVVYGSCLKENKYIQTDLYFYSVAKNCKCILTRTVHKWPCNCWMENEQKTTIKCIKNNIQVITVVGQENKGKKCITRTFVRQRTILCGGFQRRRGRCNRDNGILVITEERRVVNACACQWQIVRTRNVPCVCPKSGSSRLCIRNSIWRSVVTSYKLVDDVCHRTLIVTNRPVACRVGKFVNRSICSSSGHYKITTRTNSLVNCQCVRRVASRMCRCRCPKPYRRLKCWRRTHVWCEVNIVFALKKCVCITIRKIRKWRLPCISSRTTRTPCRPQPGGDGYRWYRKTFARRYKCMCRRRLRRWKRLCSCAPRIRRIVKCRKPRTKVIIFTKRVLTKRGRCRRIQFRRITVKIVCTRPMKRVICKKGIKTIIIKIPYIVNCNCRIRVITRHGRCKCDGRERLVRTSTCIKCKRFFTYTRLVLIGHTCVRKRRIRSKVCCCPKRRRKTRKCNRRTGCIIERCRWWVLRKGKCCLKTTTRRITTVCAKAISAQTLYLKNGNKVCIKVYYVLVKTKCKCARRRKITVIGKWKCPPPRVRIRCLHHRIWEKMRIVYKLVKKACVRCVKTRRIPVLCPFAVRSYTACRRVPYGSARLIVRRWYKRRNCKCIPKRHVTGIICRCWRRRVRHLCNRKTGVLSTIFEHFVPATSQRRCRRVVRVVRRSTRCASQWKLVERLLCHKLYRRTVRHGCKCRVQLRRVPVQTKCPKNTVQRGYCSKRTCYRIIKHISYQALRCRCLRRVYRRKQPCFHKPCPRSRVIEGKCYGGLRMDLLIYYKRIGCHCRKFKRTLRRRPKCYLVHKYAVGPCNHGSQLFAVVKYLRRGCRCIPIKRTFERFCSCNLRPTELVFVVASGYAGYRQFKASIAKFIKVVIASEPIGSRHIRVSIVRSCHRPLLLFNLNHSHPKLSLTVVRFLRRISLCCRHIHFGAALRTVRKRVLPTARQGASKLVVVVSHGRAHITDAGLASQEARHLKSKGVVIKAIGVNAGTKKSQLLKSMVSNPSYENYAETGSVSHLLYFVDFVQSQMCPPTFK